MQLALAIEAGRAGMKAAEAAADALTDGEFSRRADAFLRTCIRQRQAGELICPETVTDAARSVGIVPPRDGRAWGARWQAARRAGLVARSNVPYPRRFGRGTPGLYWRVL